MQQIETWKLELISSLIYPVSSHMEKVGWVLTLNSWELFTEGASWNDSDNTRGSSLMLPVVRQNIQIFGKGREQSFQLCRNNDLKTIDFYYLNIARP